jgi:hypothetical protein
MVPLSEYAVVNKEATLFEAVIELEKSLRKSLGAHNIGIGSSW